MTERRDSQLRRQTVVFCDDHSHILAHHFPYRQLADMIHCRSYLEEVVS